MLFSFNFKNQDIRRQITSYRLIASTAIYNRMAPTFQTKANRAKKIILLRVSFCKIRPFWPMFNGVFQKAALDHCLEKRQTRKIIPEQNNCPTCNRAFNSNFSLIQKEHWMRLDIVNWMPLQSTKNFGICLTFTSRQYQKKCHIETIFMYNYELWISAKNKKI